MQNAPGNSCFGERAHAHVRANPPLRCWDWSCLQRRFEVGLFTVRGHTIVVSCVGFSPDGKRLATTDKEGVTVWDAKTEP
jgi:WD40 repeat protein